VAGGDRSDADARGARLAPGGPAHEGARRRRDHHDRVHLRARGKAAEISLARSLAQQLAPDNIRVLSVSPGSILFEGGSWWKRQRDNPEWIADFVRRELPFGRFGRPEEVGDVVAFLASPKASWIAGTSIVVDGSQSRSF
jgi:3-oxoacyl-[acyl-carrier protein] reductase